MLSVMIDSCEKVIFSLKNIIQLPEFFTCPKNWFFPFRNFYSTLKNINMHEYIRSENNIRVKDLWKPHSTLWVWGWVVFSHVNPQHFFLVGHFTENHSQWRTNPRIAETLWSRDHFIKAFTTDNQSPSTSSSENLLKGPGGKFTAFSETPMRWCLVYIQKDNY